MKESDDNIQHLPNIHEKQYKGTFEDSDPQFTNRSSNIMPTSTRNLLANVNNLNRQSSMDFEVNMKDQIIN